MCQTWETPSPVDQFERLYKSWQGPHLGHDWNVFSCSDNAKSLLVTGRSTSATGFPLRYWVDNLFLHQGICLDRINQRLLQYGAIVLAFGLNTSTHLGRSPEIVLTCIVIILCFGSSRVGAWILFPRHVWVLYVQRHEVRVRSRVFFCGCFICQCFNLSCWFSRDCYEPPFSVFSRAFEMSVIWWVALAQVAFATFPDQDDLSMLQRREFVWCCREFCLRWNVVLRLVDGAGPWGQCCLSVSSIDDMFCADRVSGHSSALGPADPWCIPNVRNADGPAVAFRNCARLSFGPWISLLVWSDANKGCVFISRPETSRF